MNNINNKKIKFLIMWDYNNSKYLLDLLKRNDIVMVYLGIILAIIIIYILAKYNKLVKLKNKVKQSESGIDVYLNQRFDLIPNLVECVKGYANHEKSVIENVTKMRSEYMKTNKSLKKAEELNNSMNGILAIAEGYPELKASEQFLNLQKNLSKIESQLQAARRIYNNDVTKYNTKIETVPTNLIASMFGMKKAELFQIEEYKRANIDIGSELN